MSNQNECDIDISKCEVVSRICDVLKLHDGSKLNIDDYIHMISNHSLEDVHHYVKSNYKELECNKDDCKVLTRRRSIESNDNLGPVPLESFYQHIFDVTHAFVVHAFDIGGRINKNELRNNINVNMDEKDENDIPRSYIGITDIVSNDFITINTKRSNKFNVASDLPLFTKKDDNLFMDYLPQYLLNQSIKINDVNEIYALFCANEYDSDAVRYDVGIEQKQSNILYCVNNIHAAEVIQYYVKQNIEERQVMTFAMGYRFFYWSWYKVNKNVVSYTVSNESSRHFTAEELYIEQKYDSLKDEIFNNTTEQLDFNQFQESFTKAQQYSNSRKARAITASDLDTILHYNISAGSPLDSKHLLSIILYTDWSTLSTAFAASFRAVSEYDILQNVKERNREYAIWSQLLRETVELFGTEMRHSNVDVVHFGMAKLTVQSFAIKLVSPSSTSVQIEIATQFCGDGGMIVSVKESDDYFGGGVTFFDSSWVSRYPKEDERTFCGGLYTMRICKLQFLTPPKTFINQCTAIFFFEGMVGGLNLIGKNIANQIRVKHNQWLGKCIASVLDTSSAHKIHPYFVTSFKRMCQQKRHAVFNLDAINLNLTKLKSHVFTQQNDLDINKIVQLFPTMESMKVIDTENDQDKNGFDVVEIVSAATHILPSGKNILQKIEVWVRRDCRWSEEDNCMHYFDSWAYSEFMQCIKQFQNVKISYLVKKESHDQIPYDTLVITALNNE